MKTAGQILTAAREDKKLTLAEISSATKIQSNYLKIIESDNYQRLPNSTVAKGFIKNYSQYLGLDWRQVLAIFRRDFVENPQGQIMPRGMVQPVTSSFVWTPKATLISGLAGIFLLFAGYLIYQYNLLSGPPKLVLDQPSGEVITEDTAAVISGRTDPEATLVVNGDPVILDKGGKFFFRVSLEPGENQIRVTATSAAGKSATQIRVVTRR